MLIFLLGILILFSKDSLSHLDIFSHPKLDLWETGSNLLHIVRAQPPKKWIDVSNGRSISGSICDDILDLIHTSPSYFTPSARLVNSFGRLPRRVRKKKTNNSTDQMFGKEEKKKDAIGN